jgi:hypothetical protein
MPASELNLPRIAGAALVCALLAVACTVGAPPATAAPLPPQMHTVAGGGSCSGLMTSGGPCDNVSATSVPIGQARSVAELAGGGFLYLDATNDLVRQVSPSGKVVTVAGNGTNVDGPDGTAAVSSGLNGPVSIAPLPAGGFLITEYNGAVVRMVSPAGTIATIAGTGTPGNNGPTGGGSAPATKTQLNYPSDAQPTADGSVLIADTYNNVIREVSSSGTISTIAGGGGCNDAAGTPCDGSAASAVGLDLPDSVSPIQGGAGGYLIAEYGAHAIRQVSQTSPLGAFTTVAGTPGAPGFGGDGGPATAAQLHAPEGVVSTADGGFLIADTGNEVVRQVSAGGTIATVAGTPGLASFGGDGGAATAASLDTPTTISPASDGGFLIADASNGLIRAVTIPPTTTIALSPPAPNGQNGWYVSSVHASLSVVHGGSTNCELDPVAAPPAYDAIPPPCSFSGKGADITGDGSHTLYAASVNAAGDKELPVSVTVNIDTTPPTLTCAGSPAFAFGAKRAFVSATVGDQLSGPASPVVSELADTSYLGESGITIFGADRAGNTGRVACSYTVRPLKLRPTPSIKWRFAAVGRNTMVKRLVVENVPAQAAVNIACSGTGCRFSGAHDVTGRKCGRKPCKAKRSGHRRRTVDLAPLFAGVRLAAGAKLTVSVTAPNTTGAVWLFGTRARRQPSHAVSCLQPDSTTIGQDCPAARGRR